MPFIVPTFDNIRENLLRDLKNQLPDADVTTDSDFYVRASSVASAVEGLYQHQAWIVKQIFPDTADTEYLEMHAAIREVFRKPAVAATGIVTIVGEQGTVIPQDLELESDNGTIYVLTESGVIDGSETIDLGIKALEVGKKGNTADNTSVKFKTVPAGAASQATLLEMRGGVDRESDTELLNRLLELIRRPPAGGNKYDFKRWALEVPGITNAFVYPLRRGLGTVDIIAVADDGLPSQTVLDEVRDYIDKVRPVTAKGFVVQAPTIEVVDLTILVKLSGTTLPEAQNAIETVIDSQFLDIVPGDSWIRSQAEALISNIPGVLDRVITSPNQNLDAVIDSDVVQWLRKGSLTIELMP